MVTWYLQVVLLLWVNCVCTSMLSHVQILVTLCHKVSSVHGMFQARILEWVAISSSRGSSQPRDWTYVSWVSSIGRQALYELRHCGSPSSPVVTDRSAHGGQLWGDWGSCSQCLWMWKWSGASLELTSLQGLLNESRFSLGREGTRHLGLRRGIYAEQPLYSIFGKDDRFRMTASSAEQSPMRTLQAAACESCM